MKPKTASGAKPAAGEIETAILSLLGEREPGATICPSEVARRVAGVDEWRTRMVEVHAAADRLHDEGAITLSWKGESLIVRAGPYRIGKRAQ